MAYILSTNLSVLLIEIGELVYPTTSLSVGDMAEVELISSESIVIISVSEPPVVL